MAERGAGRPDDDDDDVAGAAHAAGATVEEARPPAVVHSGGWFLPWWRSWGRSVRCEITAVAAWVITVAPVTTGRGAGGVERVLAALCLLAGVCAPVLVVPRPQLARRLGLTAFVGLAALAWTWATWSHGFPVMDSFRGALGAAAWALFALSWSEPFSTPLARKEGQPVPASGARLAPRRRTPRLASVVAGLAGAAVLVVLALPWRVGESSRAVLAHALGAAAAVALLASAASFVTLTGSDFSRDRRRRRPPRSTVRALVRGLAFMAVATLLVMALLVGRC